MNGLIVVGVDGSAESIDALRWALEEACLRHSRLRAVHAWSYPIAFAGPGFSAPLDAELIDDLRRNADQVLERALEEAGTAGAEVEIERAAPEGPAAQMLVEAAGNAELLVVGSRGHGGFAGLLLGSVSQQCAHHAPCPIVIVRGARGQRTSKES